MAAKTKEGAGAAQTVTREKRTRTTKKKVETDRVVRKTGAGRAQKVKKPKQMHNIELGKRGESAAASFLEHRGFQILERNWTCFAGEADIIALDDEAIHFIEVKTRIGEGKGVPAEAVTAKKRQRYEAIAELYLGTYDGCETGVTFDIISINVLPNDRAVMRFYRTVLGCDCR